MDQVRWKDSASSTAQLEAYLNSHVADVLKHAASLQVISSPEQSEEGRIIKDPPRSHHLQRKHTSNSNKLRMSIDISIGREVDKWQYQVTIPAARIPCWDGPALQHEDS